MSVGEPDYAHKVEAQVFKDQQIIKRPAKREFFHVIVGQERVPNVEVREAPLVKYKWHVKMLMMEVKLHPNNTNSFYTGAPCTWRFPFFIAMMPFRVLNFPSAFVPSSIGLKNSAGR